MIRVLDWTEAIYNGSASVGPDRTLASLAHFPQAKLVQLEDFSHYAALVSEGLTGASLCNLQKKGVLSCTWRRSPASETGSLCCRWTHILSGSLMRKGSPDGGCCR